MAGNSGINIGFGSEDQLLTSNGDGILPTFQVSGINKGALVFLGEQNSLAVTSTEFLGLINSTYRDYLLLLKNGTIPAYGTIYEEALIVQFSDDNGMTYKTTGYFSDTSSPSGGNSTTDGIPLLWSEESVATSDVWGYAMLMNLPVIPNMPAIAGAGATDRTIGLGFFRASGAYVASSLAVNAFRVVMTDGAQFSGIFTLYGFTY